MKTRANFYIIVIILIISILSCKKEEIVAPEKLFIGKWKVVNFAKYKNGSSTPEYFLQSVNNVEQYIIEVTENKFYVLDKTLNNKVIDQTNYIMKDGKVYGKLDYQPGLIPRGFLGRGDNEGVKVTFEGNNKMLISSTSYLPDIYEWTYSRIQ